MEVATLMDRYNRHSCPEEQLIYDHLLRVVQVESPSQLIQRFRSLFIDGVTYPDADIRSALNQVTASKFAEDEFKFVLNRCCHILINYWRTQPSLQGAIPELISLFETQAGVTTVGAVTYMRSVKRLRQLVAEFTQSEQYLTLCRLAQVLAQGEISDTTGASVPLGKLIQRYPYLYAHCLLSEESTYEQQQTVRQIQSQMQRQYEIDLSQYITYQVRRSQLARQHSPQVAARVVKPTPNPSLLSDRELCASVKQFVGRVEGPYSYRDLAQSFLTHTSQVHSYQDYKDNLYEYLTSTLDSEYGKRQFHNQLYKHLNNTIPQSNSQKLSDFLVVRTCSQLLNFLVVESRERPHHFMFMDLISNVGPLATVGLLLKIVLICRKVKPYLEKRLALLYNHYESATRESVMWLVKVLEHMNVALTTNFGCIDLSFIG